jgi:hypothetical protein
MNKVFCHLILSIACVLGATGAQAEQGWVGPFKVTKIVVTFGGGINVRVSPELTACTSQSGYGANYASVYPSHPGKDKIAAVLMTAYSLNKDVSMYLTDSTCTVGEVVLGGI